MTYSMSKSDLEKLQNDPSSFPRELTTDFLKAIIENSDDQMLVVVAQRELTIRRCGIQIYAIFPTSNEDGPGFTYSVGADRVGIPEMLTFYPSHKTNHWVINKLYQLMLDLKVELPTGPGEVVMVDDILEGLPIALTLLSAKQRQSAYEDFTCQCSSSDVPVLHVLMPLPSGDWVTSTIPDEYRVPEIEAIATDPSEIKKK